MSLESFMLKDEKKVEEYVASKRIKDKNGNPESGNGF